MEKESMIEFFEAVLKEWFFLEQIILNNETHLYKLEKKLRDREYLSANSTGIMPYMTSKEDEGLYQMIVGDGCSANYQKPVELDKDFVDMVDLEIETDKFKKHKKFLNEQYRIEYKLSKLKKDEKELILLFYRDNYKLSDLAFVYKVSKQYISAKKASIIRRLLESGEGVW